MEEVMSTLKDFASRRQRLERLAAELVAVAPGADERIVRDLHNLRENRFEVAIIGQFNAGKSTFINALIGQPGLLPTDINPWTAVITRVWFGGHAQPDGSAAFQFYTPDEWEQGAGAGEHEAGGEHGTPHKRSWAAAARDLTRKFLPNQQADDVAADDTAAEKAQREAVRRKAEEKLGGELGSILGTTRTVTAVDRAALSEFVTASGKYGEVTREADLYMDQQAFGEPFLLVDTPGMNDPFQVRSAITKRYLARADAYVVVLSAAQALSASDKAMLDELLRVMHKHRVIVLVNRVDQLNDGSELEKVVARVRGELKQWYPERPISVEPTAAYLGELAVSKPAEALKRLRRLDGFDAVGAGYGWWELGAFDAAMQRPPDTEDSQQCQMLLRFAGIERTRELVAKLVVAEKGEVLLSSAAANLLATAESVIAGATDEREKEVVEADIVRQGAVAMKAKANELHNEIAFLEGQTGSLRETLENAKVAVMEEISSIRVEIHQTLESALERRARSVRNVFGNSSISLFGPEQWTVDTRHALDDLERALLKGYAKALSRWRRFIGVQLKVMREVVEEFMPDAKHSLEAFLPEAAKELPSLEGMSMQVSVELGSWWDRFLAGGEDAREKADVLARLFADGCRPVVDALASDAVGEFVRAWEETVKSWRVVIEGCVKQADQRLRTRAAELSAVADEADEQRIAALLNAIDLRAQEHLRVKARAEAIKEKIQSFITHETPDAAG